MDQGLKSAREENSGNGRWHTHKAQRSRALWEANRFLSKKPISYVLMEAMCSLFCEPSGLHASVPDLYKQLALEQKLTENTCAHAWSSQHGRS